MMPSYLVFDVGGSAIKYGLLDQNGTILCKDSTPTSTANADAFFATIRQIYEAHQRDIVGVAFSLPGVINSDRGYTVTGGYLRFNENRHFIQDIQAFCSHPVTIENDGKCAALAEHWQGSLQDCCNAAVMVLGSGVGGGLILNHQLYKGSHFSAGEFSFVLTNSKICKDDPVHYFGKDGSALNLPRELERHSHAPDHSLTGLDFFAAVEAQDSDACDILDAYTYHLAIQIFNIQAMFDLERIAIGGGISAQPALLAALGENIAYLKEHLPFYISEPHLVACRFRNDANLIGALKAHLNQNA
jgi:predicted NBD/HSP70 family sugar kinase